MSETKREKFLRLSAARLEKAEDAIRLLGNLNSQNYESSPEDRQAIVDRLHLGINQAYGLDPQESSPKAFPPSVDAYLLLDQAYHALTRENNPERCAELLLEVFKS